MAVTHTIMILMAIAENNTTNINGVPDRKILLIKGEMHSNKQRIADHRI